MIFCGPSTPKFIAEAFVISEKVGDEALGGEKFREKTDRMWKQKRMGRSAAYKWLAAALRIEAAECHIGHMNRETARRVVSIVHEWEAENVHRLPRQLPAVPA